MFAALSVLIATAVPVLFTSGTDAPLKTDRIELPPRCALCPPGRLTCAYYPAFMVKEVDLGEIGAEVLAIVPRAPKGPAPACNVARGAGELSVSGGASPWFGYFEGALGRFVFFRSADAPSGAVPFAVYDAVGGQRILVDEASGPVRLRARGAQVGISFVRLVLAPCSPLAGGEPCWRRIKEELGVGDPAPDCASAYRKANEASAEARCRDDAQAGPRCVEQELRLRPAFSPVALPTLGYEVEVADLSSPVVRPAANAKVVSCRPSE